MSSAICLIGRDDGAKGWDRIKGQGFSMQVTTVQNIEDLAKRIKESGGTLLSEPADMSWGLACSECRTRTGSS